MENYNQILKEFNDNFNEPNYIKTFATFSNLIWQILINKTFEDKKVCFYVDVMNEKNELIIALEIGGYKKTDVFFVENNFNKCFEIVEKLNLLIFKLSKEESEKIINTSMFYNQTLE